MGEPILQLGHFLSPQGSAICASFTLHSLPICSLFGHFQGRQRLSKPLPCSAQALWGLGTLQGHGGRASPPYLGLSQWRTDEDTPPPHVRLHSPQEDQDPQAPSTPSGRVPKGTHSLL